MSLGGVLENIVADIIFLAILTVSAAALVIVTRWRTHARLLRFLGCRSDQPRLFVFFSTLVVTRFGSIGFGGVAQSYSGPAVPEAEYLLTRTISDAVETPSRSLFSRFLILAIQRIPWDRMKRWLGPQEVEVRYELSPLQVPVPLPNAATICLGSPGYNYVTHTYLSTLNPLLTFGPGSNPGIIDGNGNPVMYPGDVGMLQRLGRNDGFPVYIAAGLGVNGTRGALKHLLASWPQLERRFDTADFALALGFPWFPQDPYGSQHPVELLALSR
jgi:hypothetical protein